MLAVALNTLLCHHSQPGTASGQTSLNAIGPTRGRGPVSDPTSGGNVGLGEFGGGDREQLEHGEFGAGAMCSLLRLRLRLLLRRSAVPVLGERGFACDG